MQFCRSFYLILLCSGVLVIGPYLVFAQTTQRSPTAPLSFCTVRYTNATQGSSLLMFDGLTVNDAKFNLETSSFQVPANSGGGLYWFSWSVGILPDQQANVALIGELRVPNIIRRHTAFTGGPDTTSRFELIDLNACSTLTLSSDFPLYSDIEGLQTSFLGIGLQNTMKTVVGFNVGRSGITTTEGRIYYDVINEDTAGAYNVTTGQYTVPTTGVYVLVMSAGASTGGTMVVTLYVGTVPTTTMYSYDTAHNDVDTLGSTSMLALNQGDLISTNFGLGPLYSDIRYTTSFQGFLYDPVTINPVAWSVATDRTYTGQNNPVDPVPFNVVFVNQQQAWDVVSNRFTAPEGGVYYIQMTAGIEGRFPVKMELLLNGSPQVNIYRESTARNNVDARSRAILLRLITGDELRIRLPVSYRLYGNADRVTKFSGMRLYDS